MANKIRRLKEYSKRQDKKNILSKKRVYNKTTTRGVL